MYTLVLIRHGQSLWNAENRFTGWQDVDLSSKGKVEAKVAARALLDNEFTFDLHLATHGNHPNPEEYEINEETKNKNIKCNYLKTICILFK